MTATPAYFLLVKPAAVAKSSVSEQVKPLFSSFVEFPLNKVLLASSGILLTKPVNF